MKRYKVVMIDGKKWIHRMRLGLFFCAVLVLVFFHLSSLDPRPIPNAEKILSATIPTVSATLEEPVTLKEMWKDEVLTWVAKRFHLHFQDATAMLSEEIPLTRAVLNSGLAYMTATTATTPTVYPDTAEPSVSSAPVSANLPPDIPEENRAPIKSMDAAPKYNPSDPVPIGNETSYTVDTQEALTAHPSVDMTVSGPKVLVIHTHATESYAAENSTVYDITAGDRNTDPKENVIEVGNVLCDIFNQKGIETLHDTALHDYPSFNGSYAHALSAIEDYLQKYPSIQIVFDVHRDSIVYDDNTKARLITEINGKKAAQLMFVVGTDQKGLYHPSWRENIKNAILFQNAISKRYPTLMRRINLRQERFNGHTTKASMIIETGSSGNSLQEASYGLSLAAECLADYLLSLS